MPSGIALAYHVTRRRAPVGVQDDAALDARLL